MLYIRCSHLLTPTRLIKDAAILIDGRKILACGPASEMDKGPSGARVLDARGFTAIPGYLEWQINGGFGHDFTETPESIWEVGSRLPEYGVTAFLPTIITAPAETYSTAQKVLRNGPPLGYRGAQPLGLHFEGPFLNPAKKGAHNPAHLRLATGSEIRDWSRRLGVWMATLAPELPGALEAIRVLRKRGVRVSLGHSLASYPQSLEAFEAGATAGTHLFNAMPALDHRAPGLVGALLHSEQIYVGIIPDGIHVHPAMLALAWKQKQPGRMAIVTDAMGGLGMPPGTYKLADFDVTVDDSSARLADGTLAGSILAMDQAVCNLKKFTGCELREAVTAATLNVARLIGARNKGRLAAGADADLVLLDSNDRVAATIAGGEILYNTI
jgi:N-acetylglucosamine-6-phosphate deacetylase